MKIEKKASILIISIAVIAAILTITGRATYAQSGGASDSAIVEKMDEILSNQKLIMAELASLKEEIRIVKIRVTQSQ